MQKLWLWTCFYRSCFSLLLQTLQRVCSLWEWSLSGIRRIQHRSEVASLLINRFGWICQCPHMQRLRDTSLRYPRVARIPVSRQPTCRRACSAAAVPSASTFWAHSSSTFHMIYGFQLIHVFSPIFKDAAGWGVERRQVLVSKDVNYQDLAKFLMILYFFLD